MCINRLCSIKLKHLLSVTYFVPLFTILQQVFVPLMTQECIHIEWHLDKEILQTVLQFHYMYFSITMKISSFKSLINLLLKLILEHTIQ